MPVNADAMLHARIMQRDHAALAELYAAVSGLLHKLAHQLLGCTSEAQDVVQEVMAKFWQTPGGFDVNRGTLHGYLATATKRRAIDHLRRRGRLSRIKLKAAEHARSHTPAGRNSVETEVHRGEMHALLHRFLGDLTPAQREEVHAVYFEGNRLRTTAHAGGVGLSTFRSRLRRTLARLRDRFDAHDPEAEPTACACHWHPSLEPVEYQPDYDS